MTEDTQFNTTGTAMLRTNESLLLGLITKFADAKVCWYSSVRPDNRAHLAPIWHVWHAESIYVVTRPNSVRAQNLRFSDSVSLALPDPMNVLIIEGHAVLANEITFELQPLFQTKYNWDIISDTDYQTTIRVLPEKLLAWGDHGSGRWKFDSKNATWSSL